MSTAKATSDQKEDKQKKENEPKAATLLDEEPKLTGCEACLNGLAFFPKKTLILTIFLNFFFDYVSHLAG